MAAGTRRAKEAAANKATAEDKAKPVKEDVGRPDPQEKAAAGQPLGPPPRPSQANNQDGDYFAQNHNGTSTIGYQAEPNPFEQQFGNPSTNTPGKLPSVAQLTSPQSLMPNTPSEMRLGPLSPAMLAGPATGDYFDSSYSRSFPTPNESGLRTGLTPGGGGSMFPTVASPNTQAMYNSFGLGATTPSLTDFMRSGINAKTPNVGGAGPTSQPAPQTSESLDMKFTDAQNGATNGVFAHPESDAANGLFMLAQANGARSGNQFAVPSSQAEMQASSSVAGNSQATPAQNRRKNQSIGSSDSQGDDQSDSDHSEEPAKPATRSRGKRPAAEKPTNSRRKATDTPAKASAAKRRKTSASQEQEHGDEDDMDDMDMDMDGPHGKDTKKMTDEEKRKNFLERNRVAALKCRQRKKQWLSNLQSKVDIYSQENDALQQCCNQLREQVGFLKSALASHRGCPIFQNMGISQQQYEGFLAMEVPIPYMIPTTSAPNGIPTVTMMAPSGGQVLPPR